MSTTIDPDITVPEVITWRGPGGFTVRLDEDGVTLVPGRAVEEGDLRVLLRIIQDAMRCRDIGASAIPRPPEREPYAQIRIDAAVDEVTHLVRSAINRDCQPF